MLPNNGLRLSNGEAHALLVEIFDRRVAALEESRGGRNSLTIAERKEGETLLKLARHISIVEQEMSQTSPKRYSQNVNNLADDWEEADKQEAKKTNKPRIK